MEKQEIALHNDSEEYKTGIRKTICDGFKQIYAVYEQIFLIAYDKGIDLSRSIQEVSKEIDEIKDELKRVHASDEPEGYIGLWLVQSMADKLNVPVSQLFIQDKKLKKRVVEDILNKAINSRNDMFNDMDIAFDDESNPEFGVLIEFSVDKIKSYCTKHDIIIWYTELMHFTETNKLPNYEKVISKYSIWLCKEDGLYSIKLSGNNMQNTTYIDKRLEIYSEEHGRLQEFVDECIAFELHNLSKKNQYQTSNENESITILNDISSMAKKDVHMEIKGRKLPETELSNCKETELVAAVYDTTRTMEIMNKFEGLEENSQPYERLVIANGDRVDISSRYWMHYVIERSKKKDCVGDITFTNFKLGYIGELLKHIKEELEDVNIENYVDKKEYIKFKRKFRLRAQNKRNRTGYGWEWDWSSGYGDYTEGTLYGETTEYVFTGVYISSSYTYEQSKRKY